MNQAQRDYLRTIGSSLLFIIGLFILVGGLILVAFYPVPGLIFLATLMVLLFIYGYIQAGNTYEGVQL